MHVPLAIVGTGGMARRYLRGLHALRATDFDMIDLVAVYGRTPANAEKLADEAVALLGCRPRVWDDLGAMAAAMPEIAGVVIVTDTGSHHAVAHDCLLAGWHVLIEKPLALTIRGCNLVIDTARRMGKILSVAENYRRDPINRLAKALIDAGAIGAPRVMIEQRIGGGNQLFITPWRHQKLSGTLVLDTGVHNADIMQFYLGRPTRVYGEGRIFERYRYPAAQRDTGAGFASWKDFYASDTGARDHVVEATGEDALFAYVHFANGAIGQWMFHYAAYGPPEFRRVVYGSAGTLTCPGDRNGRPVRLDRADGTAIDDERILEHASGYQLDPPAAQLFGDERPWRYELPYADVDARLLALELHEFADCITHGIVPEVTGEVGRQAVALVNAAFESGVAGRPVTLDEIEAGAIDDYQREIDEHFALL